MKGENKGGEGGKDGVDGRGEKKGGKERRKEWRVGRREGGR